jgi:Bifunctional DNA primase/polymerase, N-terminal
MNELRDAALGYAALGWLVFPCRQAGKEPATKRGFYDATTNPERLKRLWRAGDLNIGVATGAASRFWVLDVDGAEGKANLARLEAGHGALPITRTSITARGYHLLFRYSAPLPSMAGRIAPHLDTRCDRGYIVAPPSVHPSGRTYQWLDETCEVATAPDWIVRLARQRPASISERATATIHPPLRAEWHAMYGQSALQAELAQLRATAPGSRNHALNRATFKIYQLVAGHEVEPRGIDEALIDACRANRLVQDDGLASVRATIRSAARAGMQHPRSRGRR